MNGIPSFREAPIFDADQHMYETADALTKYLPERYRYSVQYAQFGRQTRIVINNKVTDFIPNPTFERVAAPGAHKRFFAGENTEGLTLREMQGPSIKLPPRPATPRTESKNLTAKVWWRRSTTRHWPAWSNTSADDPQLTVAIIHALNEWMAEHWTFNFQNRVFSTPIINLSEVDAAQRELEYVLDNGAKVSLIKPGPVNGLHGWRSPALPEFDPFWRDVESAGLPIVLHASYPPLDEYIAKWEPPHTQNFMLQSAFRWMALGHREIADMITSLICHGTLPDSPSCASPASRTAAAGSFRCSTTSRICRRRCRRISRAPPRCVPSQHLGQPVLGGLRGRRGEHRRLGQGAVRLGLSAPEALAEPKGFWKYAEGMDVRRTYDFAHGR